METRTVQWQGAGITVNVTEQGAKILDAMNEGARGRFAFVRNHVSGVPGKDGCIASKVSDLWLVTNPRYDLYRERVRTGVLALDLPTVTVALRERYDDLAAKAEKAGKSLLELYETAKNDILDSLDKTDAGDRSDAHRQGHDTCYAHVGIATLHLHTVTGEDGRKVPAIAENGHMTVEGVMIPNFIVHRRVHVAGEWKPVNSRALTIMKEGIMAALRQYGIRGWRTLNFAKSNYTTVTFNSLDVFGFVRDVETAELDVQLGEYIRYIAELDACPMDALKAECERFATVRV